MKIRRLRRIFCVALCAAMTVSFSMSVSAAEWLVKNANYGPSITWPQYNCYTGLQYQIANGQQYWQNESINKQPTYQYNSNYVNLLGVQGTLIHTVTSETDWIAICGSFSVSADGVYAITQAITTTNTVLTNFSVSAYIKYAVIYYSSYISLINTLTSTDLKCMVAHEVGHCMGLSHTQGAAVMKDYELGASAINSVDAQIYNSVYR